MANAKRKTSPGRARDDGGVLLTVIRRAVIESGSSTYAVARAAGVDPAVLQRIMSGERADLMLSSASRLCAALGLTLRGAGGRPRTPARTRPARTAALP